MLDKGLLTSIRIGVSALMKQDVKWRWETTQEEKMSVMSTPTP